MLRVDAHHHLWQLNQFAYGWLQDPQLELIRRDFLPADLRPLMDDCGIDKTIVVQTQHDLRENDWALQLAEQNNFIAGVVGWVDLTSPACEQQLLELKDHPKFVGIRHVTQDEADDDFLVRRDVLNGLRVLEKHRVPFDLLFYVKHLRHAARVAHEVPELPLVIDHLAKPPIRTGRWDEWEEPLRAAAKFPNVYCKLSGMITEADWRHWQAKDLQPYIDRALAFFGAERCMYGSDWPVCLLTGSYREVHDAFNTCVASLSDSEQARIWGGTACEFYGLDTTCT